MKLKEGWKVGYKVVGLMVRDTNQYRSAVAYSFNRYGVVYQVGVETARPLLCGPLAVFNNLQCALSFYHKVAPEGYVFQCVYKPSADRALWRVDESAHCTADTGFQPSYNGTDYADIVILTEEIAA